MHQEPKFAVRRYPPFGRGSAPEAATIKNHPGVEKVSSGSSIEGVRRYPPFGRGAAPAIRIKNYPAE